MLSKAVTITFKDSDGNGHITIQEAIDQINAQASTTKVKASLINGQFVLTQIDNINQQITQNNSELTNITNTLALGSTSTSFDDMSEYLKQLEAQYKVVNDLIDNMRNNYNQSITRLVLNRF